ncbi:MAG: GNAT family N-acetyltransferase [Clostridia bacterium]
MLRIVPTNDKQLLNELSEQIFGKDFARSVGFVLYNSEQAVGLASLNILADKATLELVGIIPMARGQGLGDFFTRSLINTLSYSSPNIIIGYKDGYFDKFGFITREKDMIIQSKDIFFPSQCRHNTRSDANGSE